MTWPKGAKDSGVASTARSVTTLACNSDCCAPAICADRVTPALVRTALPLARLLRQIAGRSGGWKGGAAADMAGVARAAQAQGLHLSSLALGPSAASLAQNSFSVACG
jgi:hypothetical protein